MSEFVQEGKVMKVIPTKTKSGQMMYRMEVKDAEGTDTFGLGRECPDFGEGSIVSFEFSTSDNGKFFNVLGDTLEVIERVEPENNNTRGGSRGSSARGSSRGASTSTRGGSSRDGGNSRDGAGARGGSSRSNSKSGGESNRSSGGKSGGVDWEAKDKRIEMMSARNSAIEFIKLAVEADALTLPKTKNKALEALEMAVDKEAARFLEQNQQYIEHGISAVSDTAEDGEEAEEE